MSAHTREAYLAGIIDGEGHIRITQFEQSENQWKWMSYSLYVTVMNTDMTLIKWLIHNFGGQYVTRKNYHPDKWSQSYQWSCTGGQAKMEALLLSVLPYLIIKREQAKLALEFIRLNGRRDPELRRQMYETMCAMNKRGPSVETNTRDEDDSSMIESDLPSDMQSVPPVMAKT